MTDKTDKILNENFISLFSKNATPFLKHLKKNDEDLFHHQLSLIDNNNNTFFMRTYDEESCFRASNINSQDIQFLLDNGYDFTKNIYFKTNSPSIIKSLFTFWKQNFDNKENVLFSDYILYFDKLPKDTLNYLTEKILEKDPSFFQQLVDNKYYIFHKAILNSNYDLCELCFKYKLDYKQLDYSKQSVETYAHLNANTLSAFQTLKTKYIPMNEEEKKLDFVKTISWLKNLSLKIVKSSSYSSEEFIMFLEKKLPLHTKEQQEEMIATTVYSSDFTILNKALKLIGSNGKNYNPTFYPLWKNLNEAGHHHFLYYFLDHKNIPLDTCKGNNDNDSFLWNLARYLEKSKCKDYYSSGYRSSNGNGNENARNRAFHSRLLDKMNIDFLFSTDSKNNQNWFTTICDDQKLFPIFWSYLKEIDIKSPHNMNIEQNNENEYFQFILKNTWFSKNKDGKYNIENLMQRHYFDFENPISLFNIEYFKKDKTHQPYFTTEQKEIIFSFLLKKSLTKDYSDILNFPVSVLPTFNLLIDNLLNDDNFVWEKYDVKNKDGKSILIYENHKPFNDKNSNPSSTLEVFKRFDKIRLHYNLIENMNNDSSKNNKKHSHKI